MSFCGRRGRMRILYALTHTLQAKEGGACYSMNALIEEFSKKDECIPFVCPEKIRLYGLYPTPRQRARINAEYGMYFLESLIKDTNPDIVHTSGFGACLLGAFVKERFDIPWIHHCRSLTDPEFFLRVLKHATHIIVIGEWMKHTKLKNLNNPQTVVYNPVPFSIQPSFSLNGRDGIVMVGDMSGRKGVEIGVEAWRRLKKPPNLHIFGNVKRKREFQHLFYHGLVPQIHLLRAMKEAKFTLFPKRFPGWFDRTLFESQSVGTIALQSCGRNVYDVPVANAIRFLPRASFLKRTLEEVLSIDSGKYERSSKKAYEWVKENCTAQESARRVEKVYDSLA